MLLPPSACKCVAKQSKIPEGNGPWQGPPELNCALGNQRRDLREGHGRSLPDDTSPDEIGGHLSSWFRKVPCYDDLRLAISEWLADEAIHAGKVSKALAAIEKR